MKKTLFKLIGVGVTLSATALLYVASHLVETKVYAANYYSITLTNNTTNNLAQAGWHISRFQTTMGAGATAGTLNFYDNAQGKNTYTNAQYVTTLTVTTNLSSILTNSMGTVYTNVYPGNWTTFVTNAANTNALPIIYSASVVPNGATLINDVDIVTANGLACVCTNTNMTIVVQYTRPF